MHQYHLKTILSRFRLNDLKMESSENGNAADASSKRKARLRAELDSLHREMEIAEHVTERGQRRKIAPRKTQLARTKKRKLMEKVDAKQQAISVEDEGDHTKRLRGAKVALGNEVIQGSLIFGGEEETDGGKSDLDGVESGDEDGTDTAPGRYEMYGDVAALDLGDVEDTGVDETISNTPTRNVHFRDNSEAATNGRATEIKIPASGKKRTRVMYRLRSFKSYRMAQRHGAALGAHARGQPKTAVKKLGEVATDAPAAPQVYSSLGLVYENMLKEGAARTRRHNKQSDGDDRQDKIQEDYVAQRLVLAKKAYGSYHVAAVLCKKDFTLWVRAADTAMEISDLHTQAIQFLGLADDSSEEHRREKQRWIEEAKKDYTSADNLKPPGIDVAAKLAVCHMELGNLSEALTILTDLKNRGQSALAVETNSLGRRILPEQSYRVWLLYADLMLRIGHECTQWNRGIEKNDNYMFRRWLRKYSETFDWQERRLQALCLALEAASGSKSCSHVIAWTKDRVKSIESSGSQNTITADDRWHMDSHKSLAFSKSTSKDVGSTKAGSKGIEMDFQSNGDITGGTQTECLDGLDDSEFRSISNKVGGDVTPSEIQVNASSNEKASRKQQKDSLSLLTQEFEREKKQLLSLNQSNLAAFDTATESMNLETGSAAAIARNDARESLVRSQRAVLVKFVGEFHQDQVTSPRKSYQQEEIRLQNTTTQLPISASCATVCSIASELMKHCLGLELYCGGRLVGEAVSSYLKERAFLHEKRLEAQDIFARKQQSTDEAVLLHFEPYDEVCNTKIVMPPSLSYFKSIRSHSPHFCMAYTSLFRRSRMTPMKVTRTRA